MKQRELFVEEDLLRSYFKMVAFIQQTESHMLTSSSSSPNGGGGRSNRLDLNEAVVESLVRDSLLVRNLSSCVRSVSCVCVCGYV